MLGFSSDLEELPGCFDFVNANPKNIDTLIKYANTLQARIKTVNGPINTNTAVTHSARFVNNTINGQSGMLEYACIRMNAVVGRMKSDKIYFLVQALLAS